jgi:hypothetical protein
MFLGVLAWDWVAYYRIGGRHRVQDLQEPSINFRARHIACQSGTVPWFVATAAFKLI